MRPAVSCLMLALVLVFVGCARSGSNFSSIGVQELSLALPQQQVLDWFGDPLERRVTSSGGLTFEEFSYRYTSSSGVGRVVASEARERVLTVEFVDRAVNGWSFQSSYDNDATVFDLASADRILVGTTRRDEVRLLLGSPAGQARLPSNLVWEQDRATLPDDAAYLWLYTYFRNARQEGLHIRRVKSLRVYLNADGGVVKVATFEGDM